MVEKLCFNEFRDALMGDDSGILEIQDSKGAYGQLVEYFRNKKPTGS